MNPLAVDTSFFGVPIRLSATEEGVLHWEKPVYEALLLNGCIVILLGGDGVTMRDRQGTFIDELANRNVLCLRANGAVVWHIEPSPNADKIVDTTWPWPYSGLRVWQGKLVVTNRDNWLYEVNPADGSVKRIKEVR
jgi:outer membrane protein assembly factor BamB